MDKGRLKLHRIDLARSVEGKEWATMKFLIGEQYLNDALWAKFVDQFREKVDNDTAGWRGEFWGKSMRGAACIYMSCSDESLYQSMTRSVRDMLTVAGPDGKVTTYEGDNEYRIWDLWCRKYVMLGMEYYYEICRDESLKQEILRFLTRLADDILLHVGPKEGQIPVTGSGRWKGVNSVSILEPMVKLYRLSGETRYFDFASYIVGTGGAEGIDIFRYAYEDEKMPYQYGVTKAYELMSCFEGLYEYYLVTGEEKYRETVIRFARAVLRSEVTVIGAMGLTHELFDHGRNRQTAPHGDVVQETCVTVTWMKLCARLLLLTGDPAFADEIERSWFNAYLGAVNAEKKESPYLYDKFVRKYGCPVLKKTFLPFDSYSPLTASKRGEKVGGNQMFSDGSYFGCCAAIGGAGVAAYVNHAVLSDDTGIRVMFYQNGDYRFYWKGAPVLMTIRTDYPVSGRIRFTIEKPADTPMTVRIRIPEWAGSYETAGDLGPGKAEDAYLCFVADRENASLELDLAMKVRFERPAQWDRDEIVLQKQGMPAELTAVYQEPEELDYIAVQRGPVVFAMDERLGRNLHGFVDPDPECASVSIGKDGRFDRDAVFLEMREKNGAPLTLVDYASAGKDWESEITAWMKCRS